MVLKNAGYTGGIVRTAKGRANRNVMKKAS